MTTNSRKVLVVDDNVDGAEMLAMLLNILGHETRVAHSGPAALVEAKQYRPDLVLLDLGLPEIDGLAVCRTLRADRAFDSTTMVALTGWGSEEDRARTSEAGFDHHLVKPVDSTALEKLLHELPAN